jgi:hypothetical protein
LNKDKTKEKQETNIPLYTKNFLINTELNNIAEELNNKMKNKKEKLED